MEALLTQGRIGEHPFMEGADAEFLNHLDEFATDVNFKRGEVIFQEGDYADRFFLIMEGEVAVECRLNGRSREITRLGPGSVLGCCWLYEPFEWHYTARAVKPVSAVMLNGASLLIRAEEDSRFGYQLMKRMSRWLTRSLATLKRRLVEEIQAREAPGPHAVN